MRPSSASEAFPRGDWRLRLHAALPLLRNVVLLWLATRLGFVLLTYLATTLHMYTPPPGLDGLTMSWQRWDANWYVLISRRGYFSEQSVNFFPLYPAAISAVSWLLGDGSGPIYPSPDKLRLLAGMALSNLGLLAGLLAIAGLARVDGDPDDEDRGARAVRFALSYPFAFAWTAAYTEGFFLAFAALTLLQARRGRWYGAALTALLAALTRPVAIALVLPLAWEFGRQHGWWRPLDVRAMLREAPKGVLAVAAVPAGFLAFFAYAYVRFGQFMLPVRTQFTYWYHVSWPQWQTLHIALSRVVHLPRDTSMLAFELALLAGFAVVTLLTIRRMPFAYTLYTGGMLYMATASPVPSQIDLLWGSGRYLGQVIPIYLILAGWAARRRWIEYAVCGAGLLLQGALTIGFFQGQPVI